VALSIYQLKPRFQGLLRPGVTRLHAWGVTANQVTTLACVLSVALGLTLYALAPGATALFALLPVWMLLRMALNAVDGMLAREFGQQSRLGAYLNELTDVVSDAALYLPFAHIAPFDPWWIGVIVLVSALSEMAGLQGATLGASRRYEGPMGKSDRAFVFGALGLAVALLGSLPTWVAWLPPVVAALTAWSIYNRIQSGLKEAHERCS
jgi:CDP-diacylglycerol--glycerol-3-phosphate 3-phosphatidyltransferase